MYRIIVGALLLLYMDVVAQRVEIYGPSGSGDFGHRIIVLANGNYVLTDPFYDEAGINDRGAVYLYNGQTHQLISTLKGSTASDKVGYDIEPLANGNFVVISPDWDNGSVVDAGAVTWCNGTSGINGFVTSSNSLTGSSTGDKAGYGTNNPPDFENVIGLPNGNYVVISSLWNNGANTGAGAVTFCNGNTGFSGSVTAANSLIGTHANDQVGNRGVKVLVNGNYVVSSTQWSGGGATALGAATWGSGVAGISGNVSSINSFIGSVANDAIGAITPLSNGNYVISSRFCSINGIINSGAVTWADGSTGLTGNISAANCLYGTTNYDGLSTNIFPLTNGNYVVVSSAWDNGAFINAGAVTWINGSSGLTGSITGANSFIGTKTDDAVGNAGIVALPDGNYLICSDFWDNGALSNVGAVTWASGVSPLTGSISSSNSIVGILSGDRVGENRATILTNGNYVIRSQRWDGNRGAVTWCDKNIAPTGNVSALNSLTGVNANDFIGSSVIALTNGNYVVASRNWDNGAVLNVGAVTWCDGTLTTIGQVTEFNSIVGSIANDNVGSLVVPLSNGHYVIASSQADINSVTDAGAVTWCNGTLATTGIVSAANSFIGTTAGDAVGSAVFPMPTGNYLINSPMWDGNNPNNVFTSNISAVTFCNGNAVTSGTVTTCNSVRGSSSYSGAARNTITYNTVNLYPVLCDTYDNKTTIFLSTEPSLSNHQDQVTRIVTAGTTLSFINNSCRLNTKLESVGPSPAAGSITSYNWIEPSVPEHNNKPFVARHYQIQFNTGVATTATGRLTLYFTQQEFDDFNNHSGSILNLPTTPADNFGKENLRIGKYSGVSNNGTGLPGTYNSSASVINPDDNDIIWNATFNRWEVTFSVTGFSGFIVQTHEFVLPLNFLSFTTQKCNSNNVCLTWKTANEQSVSHFEIERSLDGRNFSTIKGEPAKNQPLNLYSSTDDVSNITASKVYYRIKQIDADSKSTLSNIQAVSLNKTAEVTLYPNPATDVVSILGWQYVNSVLVFDVSGKLVLQPSANFSGMDISGLPKGLYTVKVIKKDGEAIHMKLIKQ